MTWDFDAYALRKLSPIERRVFGERVRAHEYEEPNCDQFRGKGTDAGRVAVSLWHLRI